MLERFGLGVTASTPSAALLGGSLVSLMAPGLASLVVARGGESVFRSSLYRAGYELFYTPIPAAEKRAAKSLIDVAFDRLGEGVGGGLVRFAMVFLPAVQSSAILWFAVVCSVGAVVAASRLNRGYIATLQSSLVNRGGGIDVSVDTVANRTLMRHIQQHEHMHGQHRKAPDPNSGRRSPRA